MLPPEQEPGHNEEFHHTGNGSSQRGALDLQTGRAEVAEDEYPVEEGIHHKGGGVDHQRDAHCSHGPQQHNGVVAQGIEGVNPADDSEVPAAGGNDFGVIGEDGHDDLGTAEGSQGEEQRNADADPVDNGEHLADLRRLALAPVLGHQHIGAACQSEVDYSEHKEPLVCQGRGGKLYFTHTAQHEGIQHADAHCDQVLYRHRNGNGPKLLIEGRVICKDLSHIRSSHQKGPLFVGSPKGHRSNGKRAELIFFHFSQRCFRRCGRAVTES